MLVERGLSRDMAATVVENISGQLPEAAEPYNQPEARGFGNLHLDLWRIVRSNPLLFIVIPTLVWFPFNLFAEYVVLSRGGSFMTQLGVYNRASAIPSILVGAWIAATLFTAIRRLAEGSSVTVGRAILDGTRQYGDYLKTTWSFSWRTGLAMMAFIIPGIIVTIWFALAIPITAFEGISGKDAVYKSRELMRGQSWRLIRYSLLFILVYLPWGFGIIWLMPTAETPLLNALSTIPFDILIAFWWIWLALMYVDITGNRALVPPVGAAETRGADGKLRRGTPRGRKRLATTAVLGIALMVFAINRATDEPVFEGSRIIFGDNQQHEIYYDDSVGQAEAWLMGDALVSLGLFDGEESMFIRLKSVGPRYWLYIPAEADVRSDEETMRYLQTMESHLSEFMGKPTRIVLLVASFSGWDEIPVSGWGRSRQPRQVRSDSDQGYVLRQSPPAIASAEPVLNAATANPDVAGWVEQWTEVCGTLYPWSFEFIDVQERSLNPDASREITWLAEGEALDVLRSTLEWSPSKDLALNMFVHNLGRSGSEWSPHREEPDRWLYLFKTPDAKGWPVLVVGPSTLLHSIGWTDDQVSIVLGIARDGSADCLYIWRMLVTDTIVRVERHKGPDVTPAQLEELKHRWPAWIRARYPEVEWAAQ